VLHPVLTNNSPTSPEHTDPFDVLLRESEAHVPDDGFTARVLANLPSRRRSEPLRLALFAAAWLAGVATLLVHAPNFAGITAAFLQQARHVELAALIALAPVVFAAGCLVWALAVRAIEELG
jgi:hypothetical protein